MDTNLFKFVSSKSYRSLLESDYLEVESSIASKAYKAAVVLSGSLAEAILTDYLLDSKVTSFLASNGKSVKTTEAGLALLLDFCRTSKLISDRTFHMLQVIRDYRNFIHPDKQVRSELTLTENEAKLAKTVINIIIEEVSEKRKESFGSTADQLVDFVTDNDDAVSLFPHVVKSANSEDDRSGFLTKAAPEKLLGLIRESNKFRDHDGDLNFSDYYEQLHYESINSKIETMKVCYSICFDLSSLDSKKAATEQYLRSLKFGKSAEKTVWQELFHPEMLALVVGVDRDLLAEHLLNMLKRQDAAFFIRVTKVIAPILSEEESGRFADVIKSRIHLMYEDDIVGPFSIFLGSVRTKYPAKYAEILEMFRTFAKTELKRNILEISTVLNLTFVKIGEPNPPEENFDF